MGPLMKRQRPRQLQRSTLISTIAILSAVAAVAGLLAGVYDDELAGQQGTVVDGQSFWTKIVQLEPVAYIPCWNSCVSPTQNFTFHGAEFSVFLNGSAGLALQLEGIAHWNNGGTWLIDLGVPPLWAFGNLTQQSDTWPTFLGPGDQIGLRWDYSLGLALLVRV